MLDCRTDKTVLLKVPNAFWVQKMATESTSWLQGHLRGESKWAAGSRAGEPRLVATVRGAEAPPLSACFLPSASIFYKSNIPYLH